MIEWTRYEDTYPPHWRAEAGPLWLTVTEPEEAGEPHTWRVAAACGCCGGERTGTAVSSGVAAIEATAAALAWLSEGTAVIGSPTLTPEQVQLCVTGLQVLVNVDEAVGLASGAQARELIPKLRRLR